jgi:hypothetical protein
MYADDESLIAEHRTASRRYREAVKELERIRRQRDPEAFVQFERLVVTPARQKCWQVLQTWYERQGLGRNNGSR